jgi:hypothetical protein
LRKRQQGEKRPVLKADEIERVIREVSLPTAQEQADNLVRWLGEHTRPGQRNQVVKDSIHGAIAGSQDEDTFAFVVNGLMGQGLLQKSPVAGNGYAPAVLTFDGWNRYQELKRGDISSTTAFMAMPFGQPMINEVLDRCFRPAVAATGFVLEKLNDRPKAGLIDDRLRVAIQSCRFLIADVTHQNRGAYWESGYAEGLGKPVIYTCELSAFDARDDKEGVHFDTNHHLHVRWEKDKLHEAGEELKATIRATIPEAKRDE